MQTAPAAIPPNSPPAAIMRHDLSPAQKLYLWLTCISAACLLIGDIVGIKLFQIPLGFTVPVPWSDTPISAIEHTCGMLTFPVTFLITDLINEYYGKLAARRVAYIGLAMALFVFCVINIAQAMPYLPAAYNVTESNFNAIFASAKGMYVASMFAYIIGQLSDIAIFGLLKRATRGKAIWLRATGSTVISQLIDSFVVSFIAFYLWRKLFPDPANAPAPFSDILKIATTGYALKFVIAIALTPLIYAGHTFMERVFGLHPLPAELKS